MNPFLLPRGWRTVSPFGVQSELGGLLRRSLSVLLLLATVTSQAATYSGRVLDANGSPASGVTITYTWSGNPGTHTTDANGNWSSPNWLITQNPTFTPSQSGYTFTPPSRSYTTPLAGNISGVDFTRYTRAAGQVSRNAAGLGGVTVTLTGPNNRTATTPAGGNYNFASLPSGTYTITPSRPGTVFSPASRVVSLGQQQLSLNFNVVLPTALTLPVADVAHGNATLRGSLEGNGLQTTTAWFEYGPDGNFIFNTPLQVFAASTSTTPVSAPVTIEPAGVIYHYRLVTANANGTNVAAAQTFPMPFPAAANALAFNGQDSYVNLGANPVLKLTTNLTLEAWINPTANPATTPMILNKEGEYQLWRHQTETIHYALANTSPGWVSVNTGIAVPTNEWTHVALTYDANVSTNQVRFYTNAVLAYVGEASGPIGDAASTQNDLRIGSRQAGGSFWVGMIDEVRVWNGVRTATEIQSHYQRRLTGSEARLLLYLKFNEITGMTTADAGPFNLGGTLVNTSFVPSGARVRDPLAETLSPTPVLATRATLLGSVNPGGALAAAYFEYGETIAYGRTIGNQDLGGGIQFTNVSAVATNLQPGTTYHYRSVAVNEFGTTYGENQTFNTLVLGVGWPTATKVTGGFTDSPRHVVDSEGNAYVAGRFSGSATFKNTLNAENGTPDAFVGKLGRGADWVWENRVVANAAGAVSIHGLAVDAARNVYVAGQFSGTVTLGTNVLNAGGQTDAFVAKLSSDGNAWLWARSAGAAQPDSANALAVTPAGAVFVAGHFRGTVNFGTNQLVSAAGSQDLFVAKLATNGTWLWARAAGGTNQNDTALAVALNNAEDVYVTGRFQGTNAAFGGTTLNAAGGNTDTDLFLARLNTDGLWLLARSGGGNQSDTGTGLALDAAENIFLLGQFGGTANFAGFTNLNENAGARLFVAKLEPNAIIQQYAQAGAGYADSIVVDGSGRVYIAGEFTVSTTFGSPPAISLFSGGSSDVFLGRLDPGTNVWVWAKRIGSTGAETRGSVAVDGQGSVVVSGTFQATVPVGYVQLTTSNERDIFVARLDPQAIFEHNNYVVGQAIPVPLEAQDSGHEDGRAIGKPTIIILEKEHADSDALNSFVWSLAERKLYPVRPVTAILRWPLTTDVTNTTSVATAVGRAVFPAQPRIHVANAPVELEPAVPGFPYRFLNLAFTTINGANVESSAKVFHAAQPGWTVLQFLDTDGELPNPAIHPSRFEVARTVIWNDPAHLTDNQPAIIGSALTHPQHNDPTTKNGHVYFEKAFYDGTGEERAYDRAARTGPILPVNRDTAAADDDLVVVWYRAEAGGLGIAWPSLPVRYLAQWPNTTNELVLASGAGSGVLDALTYPSKRLYNQPDPTLPGYNPNEEHAALYGDVLYALRHDLNAVVGVSEPYSLLKYRDPLTSQWAMKVYRVVATNAGAQFAYDGEAGKQLQPPAPLSLLTLCGTSNTWISGPGFKDHLGRLYARAAGPNDTSATIVTRLWYPLQPGFFYDLDRNGQPDAPIGDCVPWLDRRPGGTLGVPVNITYNIVWPTNAPTLQIGETLLGAKFGLPDLRNFAHARIIFDEGDPGGTNGVAGLTRMFDPLASRTVQLRPVGATDFLTGPGYSVFRVEDPAALFATVSTVNNLGQLMFTDLPFTLRARLRYDPINHNLIFRGLLDESQYYGGPDNPLLLLNVLSPRERDRLKQLNTSPAFGNLVDALYHLSRNPNQLDLDNNNQPDPELLVGLIKNAAGQVVPEVMGDNPKVLTAGQARGHGFITVVENNDPSLGGLPVTLHVIRVDDGPVRGDIKVVQSDNVFDEKLTLRHSADFGGEPQKFQFEWFYRPVEAGTDPSAFPTVLPNGNIADLRGWTQFFTSPPDPTGLNDITLGDGGTSSLLVLADNYFVCRYRGYVINNETNWSDWVGIIGGGEAQLAEGWVKRVRDGLNPFEARTKEFHANETVTFASMLQQAGRRYEGDIAFNPGGSINSVGLIEAYETVLRRAKRLSIEGVPAINYQPANDALLLAAGFIADLYFLLGNEAVADAADPTIGFRTTSAGYGTLAPSIFAFQNQLDSLLAEELSLLRGRDDSSATVRLPPVYNRLFWNFTRDEGEVAYAQAYNITDRNGDGFIDATDARIMYPQAHGDAWGHYLTATKTYYQLLQNIHFDWIPRSEPILLAGVPVMVDYLDERKFARAAAAKAKVGTEVVDLTYRVHYVDDPAGQFQGYKDTDAERAWGVTEWAQRAGSAALFDWVVANAVLPAVDPNPTNTGIAKIDRTTVPELGEIVAAYETVQSRMDKADAGLNPLGIAKNSVPFDIDPSLIASGKTHFEQIYDRALGAVNNTVTVFNHANQLSQALRGLQDTVNQFSQNVTQQERDLKNRLIEIFGYPYAGDIGAGKTYPAGYDGPDIYHYMYVNTVELNGQTAPQSQTFTGFFTQLGTLGTNVSHYYPDDLARLQNPGLGTSNILAISFPYTTASYGFTAPTAWGQRRAPGDLQRAISEMLQSETRYKQALLNYDNLLRQIDDAVDLLAARHDLRANIITIRRGTNDAITTLEQKLVSARRWKRGLDVAAEDFADSGEALVEGIPKVVGLATDGFAPLRSAFKFMAFLGGKLLKTGSVIAEEVMDGHQSAIASANDGAQLAIETEGFEFEIRQRLKEVEQLIREEPLLRAEAFALAQTMNQNVGSYQAALARGLRLMEERITFRKNAAAETQQSRYQDMTFRIFRNDAIQKYRAQYDLAAQYVYLAAIAYDYETQLLGGRPGSGRSFLTDIVKQRALGEVINGVPVAGRHGLADPLARLNQNFGVLKGQLGFNNPQTETGRFSLRRELMRLRDTSDAEWRAELRKSSVRNLWDVPEFRRYCRPFAPESAGPQPGLVIRFPTTVTFGLNYFGWPLGGGDSAYDPTLFATKVRSAGVWFSDYNGSGLSITPRVYLVPAGADVMRSPSGNNLETREWRVVDQKIPVPFPVGFSSLNNSTWIPMNDSLSDTFADIRRFSSFRAFHDSGIFDPSETITDTRLIGRSVWNTDWMLIIPGGTFLFDPNEGLDTFISSVSDIKIFFQTYAYSGN